MSSAARVVLLCEQCRQAPRSATWDLAAKDVGVTLEFFFFVKAARGRWAGVEERMASEGGAGEAAAGGRRRRWEGEWQGRWRRRRGGGAVGVFEILFIQSPGPQTDIPHTRRSFFTEVKNQT